MSANSISKRSPDVPHKNLVPLSTMMNTSGRDIHTSFIRYDDYGLEWNDTQNLPPDLVKSDLASSLQQPAEDGFNHTEIGAGENTEGGFYDQNSTGLQQERQLY